MTAAQMSVETQIANTELFNYYCNRVGNAWISQVANGFEISMRYYIVMSCDGLGSTVSPVVELFPLSSSGQIAMYPSMGSIADRVCTLQLVGPDPYSSSITNATNPTYVYFKLDVSCMPSVLTTSDDCDITSFWDWINPIAQFQCGTWWFNAWMWIYADIIMICVVGGVTLIIFTSYDASTQRRRLNISSQMRAVDRERQTTYVVTPAYHDDDAENPTMRQRQVMNSTAPPSSNSTNTYEPLPQSPYAPPIPPRNMISSRPQIEMTALVSPYSSSRSTGMK